VGIVLLLNWISLFINSRFVHWCYHVRIPMKLEIVQEHFVKNPLTPNFTNIVQVITKAVWKFMYAFQQIMAFIHTHKVQICSNMLRSELLCCILHKYVKYIKKFIYLLSKLCHWDYSNETHACSTTLVKSYCIEIRDIPAIWSNWSPLRPPFLFQNIKPKNM
jgi:hypothetical protein